MYWVIAVAILFIPANLTAETHDKFQAPLVAVRWYERVSAAQEIAAAQSLAARILREAGIAVSWHDCWSSATVCQLPPRANELILRVVRATDGDASAHEGALGFSLIDVSARAGSMATVYADRVAALARDGGLNRIDLLARTVAHEIGHLLLGTTRHADSGLMRPLWTLKELRRNMPRDWQFSKQEAQAMQWTILSARTPATEEGSLATR